jgi:c(7)-type cytochrome triheme protein
VSPPPSRARHLAVAAAALACLAMRTPVPHELGRVVLADAARAAGVPPVAFDHWRHRAGFTCRVCHVDVGFAMVAGETGISAETNRSGFHCGACHGKLAHQGKLLFPACDGRGAGGLADGCRRCHARPDPERLRAEYAAFAARLPRTRAGAVEWQAAEEQRRIRPADQVEGLSVPRSALRMHRDVAIEAKAKWAGGIVFSHRKHAVWNGCEVCHPDIFPATAAGEVSYTMFEIVNGRYCGACHDKVAFALAECTRCHVKPVQ